MSRLTSDEDPDFLAMARLKAGEDLALNEIMDRWTPRIHAFLLRSLNNPDDARDLTQETFVAVYASRLRYRPSAKFSTWLFGIAANLARERIRWRTRHPEVALALEKEAMQAPPGEDELYQETPATLIETAERNAAVRDAIESLPWSMRQLVILSQYEKLPQAEISAIAGCSIKAVETRLYRARKILSDRLRTFFEKEGQ
ncbi:MAG: RNA polymerase sigma factor [Puniceicoccaceae bacterium]